VVVVSVGKDLQLDKGPVGKALLSKAGPMLQTDLKKEGGGRTPEEGSVLKTKGYNLACSVVLHAVVPAWSQKNAPSKVLGHIITKCLEIAEELSLKSITFPAIGTGNLGFPRSVVANLLFDKVFEFSSENRVNSLEEVHFLLHTKDTANIQVSYYGFLPVSYYGISEVCISFPAAFSAISSTSAQNMLEMTIGSIVFRVAEGDITKEEGDAIVNITNQAFNLKTGVSKAILSGAGKAVKDECGVLAQQTQNNYIITQAGNLPCKNIIHIIYRDDIKFLVSQVLQECELQQYTSVTFPAIGTGEARRNPAEVADNVIDAVTDFAKRNSDTSVKTIKVVIFQPHLMSVFQASMQKREKSIVTRIKSFVSKTYQAGRYQNSTMLPPTWDPMENELLKIVELKSDSKDYKDVQEQFLQTCQSYKIEKIERVQNQYLWKSYQIKKCEMDKKNGSRNNERLLFHGTSQESLTLINNRGFNRSYAGVHAANFGNGTYFAVNASYSAHDTYSKPDANGKKYMYLARVLVGEYSLGRKGSITPAQKNVSNSVDLFDSSTDNISQPSMFIIFNDVQAYPEHLITFT
ncbi:PAR15 polymerase, partial [Bombycilla garrulus]|nr:PAR15 polymerase [Bombycilla garrulus]